MSDRFGLLSVILVTFSVQVWLGPVVCADEDSTRDSKRAFEQLVKPFLKSFCGDCHGPDDQSGDRRFDLLVDKIDNENSLVDYQDIVDQLNLGDMPPPDAEQPSDEERQRVIDWMTLKIKRYHSANQASGGHAILRRLNSREYRNTIHDLFGLDVTIFDPAEKFPRDQTIEQLDNVGETLVISGHLLARYLDAADRVIEKAKGTRNRPEVQTWVFQDRFRQQPEIDQVHGKTNGFEHMTLYDVIGADKHEGAYGPILRFAEGVPLDGIYEIQFLATAVNREHPYQREFLGIDPDEPFRLGIRPGNREVGNLHLPQPIEPLLAEVELADRPKTYTVRVHLDAGYTPRFTFRNGLMDARNLWSRVIRQYPDMFPKGIKKGIVAARYNAIAHGKLPHIEIDNIEIRGPLHDAWPTVSQKALFGDDWEGEPTVDQEIQARDRLAKLARKAYRRPVAEEEIDRIMSVFTTRREAGRDWIGAYADAAKAILCSPGFLYLEEAAAGEAYALASRLSYFLWSSMPDSELIELASEGELLKPQVLRSQVHRMLIDQRSDALVEGFLGSWLGLRDLGSTPPDRGSFPDFYHYDLGGAMRQETFLFTRHMIDENLPARLFLDSDFTFVNRSLARHYGLEPPQDRGFQRVELQDRRRGGLLGQASVLTLTANGIDTSPVLRGVWLLDNLFGSPPDPPPPDVEPLDPDTRGATTIRDQLEKHRSVASCRDCHRKIDPLGFALENFDPIGGWRDGYGRGKPIDASGELPGGQKFLDVVEFKEILIRRRERFVRALVEKLLAYAVGRRIEPLDRPDVDQILESTQKQQYAIADIITEVVLSKAFREF